MPQEDIELRELTAADLPVLFLHQLDAEATAVAAFPSRNREEFFAHWQKILANPSGPIRGIVAHGRLAGYIASCEAQTQRVIAYWLGKEYWGRGIASSAMRHFLKHEPQRPLYAHVAKTNPKSARVLEKNGFKAESVQSATIRGETAEETVYVLVA